MDGGLISEVTILPKPYAAPQPDDGVVDVPFCPLSPVRDIESARAQVLAAPNGVSKLKSIELLVAGLSVHDIAEELHVHPRTLRRWRADGLYREILRHALDAQTEAMADDARRVLQVALRTVESAVLGHADAKLAARALDNRRLWELAGLVDPAEPRRG